MDRIAKITRRLKLRTAKVRELDEIAAFESASYAQTEASQKIDDHHETIAGSSRIQEPLEMPPVIDGHRETNAGSSSGETRKMKQKGVKRKILLVADEDEDSRQPVVRRAKKAARRERDPGMDIPRSLRFS